MSEEEKFDKSKTYDGVFAGCDTREEAEALNAIVEAHCPWPLIYELADGTFEVGGLSRSGGKLNKEASEQILKSIESYVSKSSQSAPMFEGIDADKFRNTVEALKKKD